MQENLEAAFKGCFIRIRLSSVFKYLKGGQVLEKTNFNFFFFWKLKAEAKIRSVS